MNQNEMKWNGKIRFVKYGKFTAFTLLYGQCI